MSKNPSTPTLLSTLTDSLTSSLSSLPSPSAIRPPPSSFSLLSTKNELFLSYLQNLTLLIILTLRAHPARTGEISTDKEKEPHRQSLGNNAADDETSSSDLRDAVVDNLVRLRVYLEKGVRPLEGRLKYQLDKLLLAAADHARESAARRSKSSRDQIPESREEESNNLSDDEEEESNAHLISSIPPLAHRPNPSSLIRPSSTSHTQPPTSTPTSKTAAAAAPYRPPRINPTAPPLPSSTSASASKRAPRRSRAMDAFILEEMGDAPVAEMSIGAGRGRGVAAEGGKQAERERERKEWEETRLVRLPGEKKRRRGGGGGGDMMAGMGLDWGLTNEREGEGDDRGGGGEGRERKRKKGKHLKEKKGGNRKASGK